MLPASYQLPAAAVLLAGGIISCFFGYRLFRTVLAIFGFILGALATSSIFGITSMHQGMPARPKNSPRCATATL